MFLLFVYLYLIHCFQSPEFETVLQHLVQALCCLGNAEAIQGLYVWCKDGIGRKMTWIKAAVEKAYGR